MNAPTHVSSLPYQEALLIVTLVLSMISMAMSSLALLPHIKGGATMVRDAVLWVALVVVFLSLVGVGWRYWTEQQATRRSLPRPPSPVPAADSVGTPPAVDGATLAGWVDD